MEANDAQGPRTGTKQVSIRTVLLTYPQCPVEPQKILEEIRGRVRSLDFFVVAQEKHKDGQPHIHAVFKLSRPIRTRISGEKLRELFDIEGFHADVELLKPGKDTHRAIMYTIKDGNYICENVDIEAIKNRAEHNSHRRLYTCKEVLETPIMELVEKNMIPAQQFTSIFRAQQQWKLISTPNIDLCGPRGLWFYGPAGTGKSMKARLIGMQEGGYYLKAQNKWWDGYQNEPVVIIDDLDTSILSHYLKIWGDKYAFSGETKGGTMPIPCKKIIITSNYSIEELLTKDNRNDEVDIELWHAIQRRYKEVFFNHVWTAAETEAFNIQQEDEAARLLRAERNNAEEPQNKKAPTLEEDVPTPNIDVPHLMEVPQQEELSVAREDSYSLVLEGHTALNLFADTALSGFHE